jgi:hypothetical protein
MLESSESSIASAKRNSAGSEFIKRTHAPRRASSRLTPIYPTLDIPECSARKFAMAFWAHNAERSRNPLFRPPRQNAQLPVTRDGESAVPSKRPGVANNIHRGSNSGTSSDGCQTVPPPQWDEFYATVVRELKCSGKSTFDCILIEGPIN